MKNTTSRRIAAAAGIAGVSAVALASMGVGAAAAGPLPGGKTTQTLDDGTQVTVSLFGEKVNYTPSMAAVPTSRNVWMDGKIAVNISGGAEGGTIEAGYLVGCQLQFGATAGAKGGIGGAFPATPGGSFNVAPEEAKGDAGFTLAPGEAKPFPFFDESNGSGFDFEGATGGLVYSQETIGIPSCAGFAEAKAYVKVTVETESTTGIVTLWGKPFSIG